MFYLSVFSCSSLVFLFRSGRNFRCWRPWLVAAGWVNVGNFEVFTGSVSASKRFFYQILKITPYPLQNNSSHLFPFFFHHLKLIYCTISQFICSLYKVFFSRHVKIAYLFKPLLFFSYLKK